MSEIEELTQAIREFANKRDWGVFHTPKNLAMAITGEAGELAAEFQWLTPEEANTVSGSKLEEILIARFLRRLLKAQFLLS